MRLIKSLQILLPYQKNHVKLNKLLVCDVTVICLREELIRPHLVSSNTFNRWDFVAKLIEPIKPFLCSISGGQDEKVNSWESQTLLFTLYDQLFMICSLMWRHYTFPPRLASFYKMASGTNFPFNQPPTHRHLVILFLCDSFFGDSFYGDSFFIWFQIMGASLLHNWV